MNTPNPLIPQGSLPTTQSHGKSTIRFAVFGIIALHAVFFTGLLMQGCGGDNDKLAGKPSGSTNLTTELTKLETNYYGFRELPSVATNAPVTHDLVTSAPAQPAVSSTVLTNLLPPVAEVPPQAKEYLIAKDDNLYKIAKAHGTTVAALTKANPGIVPTKLKPGQKIQIPAAPAPAAGALGFAEPSPSGASSNVHVVKAGETLGKIATQHGTTAKALKAANNLRTDRILAGQKLKLPPQAPRAATSGPPAAATNAGTTPLLGSPLVNPR